MSKELIVKNDIMINASPAEVWDALIDPEKTKVYMFGCEAISDWQVGSPLIWKGVFDGNEIVAVKGEVKTFEKEKVLAYTTIDPHADLEDIPENYTTVSCTLSAANDQTKLSVTQGDFANVADGERRYNDTISGGGWGAILTEIKNLVESK